MPINILNIFLWRVTTFWTYSIQLSVPGPDGLSFSRASSRGAWASPSPAASSRASTTSPSASEPRSSGSGASEPKSSVGPGPTQATAKPTSTFFNTMYIKLHKFLKTNKRLANSPIICLIKTCFLLHQKISLMH